MTKLTDENIEFFYVFPEVNARSLKHNPVEEIRKELFGEETFEDLVPLFSQEQIIAFSPQGYSLYKYFT